LTTADPAIALWVVAHRTAAATAIFLVVTEIHSTLGIDLMLAATCLLLATRRRWRAALWLIACVQGAMLLNVLLKVGFDRHRPELDAALVLLTTNSFPSGHALASTVWWGCVVFLVAENRARRSAHAMRAFAAVMVVLTCFSRVYLGAHYTSDVFAGVFEGLVWLGSWRLIGLPSALRAAGP
jgi:membrane-associated phospholipid phosphatase